MSPEVSTTTVASGARSSSVLASWPERSICVVLVPPETQKSTPRTALRKAQGLRGVEHDLGGGEPFEQPPFAHQRPEPVEQHCERVPQPHPACAQEALPHDAAERPERLCRRERRAADTGREAQEPDAEAQARIANLPA